MCTVSTGPKLDQSLLQKLSSPCNNLFLSKQNRCHHPEVSWVNVFQPWWKLIILFCKAKQTHGWANIGQSLINNVRSEEFAVSDTRWVYSGQKFADDIIFIGSDTSNILLFPGPMSWHQVLRELVVFGSGYQTLRHTSPHHSFHHHHCQIQVSIMNEKWCSLICISIMNKSLQMIIMHNPLPFSLILFTYNLLFFGKQDWSDAYKHISMSQLF